MSCTSPNVERTIRKSTFIGDNNSFSNSHDSAKNGDKPPHAVIVQKMELRANAKNKEEGDNEATGNAKSQHTKQTTNGFQVQFQNHMRVCHVGVLKVFQLMII